MKKTDLEYRVHLRNGQTDAAEKAYKAWKKAIGRADEEPGDALPFVKKKPKSRPS
jgi:hypothetical protein